MNSHHTQKIHIAIYGTLHYDMHHSSESIEKAIRLGEDLAKKGIIVHIPTFPGFPFWVAKGAQKAGGFVIGFSPAANEEEHVKIYKLPLKYTDTVIYSGFGFAGSDLLLSRSSDAIIFGYGGIETVHEFWVAFQEDKPIGILKGDWDNEGVLFQLIQKDPQFDANKILFSEHTSQLVDQLVKKAKIHKVKDFHF